MEEFELTIVDVGHGNASVVRERDAIVVVDTSVGNALLLYLQKERIESVELVVLSHSDADHIGGLIGLLNSEITVRSVILNADASKDSETWRDLIFALEDARRNGKVDFDIGIYEGPLEVDAFRECRISVISPTRTLAALGVGARDREGRTITSNSMSAAIRVEYQGLPVALLTGDMDEVSLRAVEEAGTDAAASVLIFPHHGGLPGGADVDDFVQRLINVVRPHSVIFSNGRGRHDNPRLEVVESVRRISGNVYIGCTQLSNNCSIEPAAQVDHLGRKYASGSDKRRSCAGSVTCLVQGGDVVIPGQIAHVEFVNACVANAMCVGRCAVAG